LSRQRPPNRCPSETITITSKSGKPIHLCIGYDPVDLLRRETWRPLAVFIDGEKEGTGKATDHDDLAIILSRMMQEGIPASALLPSLGEIPVPGAGKEPSSDTGLIVAALAVEEPPPERVACKGAKEYNHT